LAFRFAPLENAMMERYEILVSVRDAEALATMLGAHRRANPFEADASDELADLLMEARLVASDMLPADRVALHSRVTYEEQPSGMRRVVTLVLPEAADPAKGRISVLSPIGLALVGRERGSAVTAAAPNGRALNVRIIDTQRDDRSAGIANPSDDRWDAGAGPTSKGGRRAL
jgi:regulator of nucleoside diphosphate kinase